MSTHTGSCPGHEWKEESTRVECCDSISRHLVARRLNHTSQSHAEYTSFRQIVARWLNHSNLSHTEDTSCKQLVAMWPNFTSISHRTPTINRLCGKTVHIHNNSSIEEISNNNNRFKPIYKLLHRLSVSYSQKVLISIVIFNKITCHRIIYVVFMVHLCSATKHFYHL